jgi:sec-independent protein translocase protein TatA
MGLDNPTHWIPVLVLLLLLFGAKRLPEIGRSLGSGIREFKRSVTGESEQTALSGAEPRPAAIEQQPSAGAGEVPAAPQHADTRAA